MSRTGLLVGAAIVALGAASGVRAGSAYLESQVTTGAVMGQPARTSTQKMWFSDDRIRVDHGDEGSYSVIRRDQGKVYIIDAKKKTYAEMTLEQMKAMAEMGMAMMGNKDGAAPKVELTRTAETAKIGEWTATKAILTVAAGPMQTEMTLWVSKDIALDMKAWADVAQSMGMRGMMGDMAEKMATLEGYPVKQDSTVNMMGMKITSSSELKVFKPGPVEASLFEVPAGFTKTEGMLPGMPAGAGAGRGK